MTVQTTPRRPGKIVAVGLNYRDHAAESGSALPERPLLFAIWPSAVIGDGEDIVLPNCSREVDFEAELGVVIGKCARNVPSERALDYVAGLTCVNDISARDVQMQDGQWTRGKSFDTFCPVGPVLVPLTKHIDIGNLGVRSYVNGELMQDSSTSELIFGVTELIEFISHGVTLEPGDLIATGTPAGVGFARRPSVFLQPGDTVSIEIEHVGTLTNGVVASAP